MPTRKFERNALLFLSGCAIVFAATVMLERAQAQYVPPPTPLPPPVFNPSSPYTVPQPTYRPIAPSTPSASPQDMFTRLRRLDASRGPPRARTNAPPPQHDARCATGAAPSPFARRRSLIRTITLRLDMAMVAPGRVGLGQLVPHGALFTRAVRRDSGALSAR